MKPRDNRALLNAYEKFGNPGYYSTQVYQDVQSSNAFYDALNEHKYGFSPRINYADTANPAYSENMGLDARSGIARPQQNDPAFGRNYSSAQFAFNSNFAQEGFSDMFDYTYIARNVQTESGRDITAVLHRGTLPTENGQIFAQRVFGGMEAVVNTIGETAFSVGSLVHDAAITLGDVATLYKYHDTKLVNNAEVSLGRTFNNIINVIKSPVQSTTRLFEHIDATIARADALRAQGDEIGSSRLIGGMAISAAMTVIGGGQSILNAARAGAVGINVAGNAIANFSPRVFYSSIRYSLAETAFSWAERVYARGGPGRTGESFTRFNPLEYLLPPRLNIVPPGPMGGVSSMGKALQLEEFVAPSSGKLIQAAVDGNAVVPIDKVSIYARGGVADVSQELRSLQNLKQSSRKLFDSNPGNADRLDQLKSMQHNYERSTAMARELDKVGLTNTPANNKMIINHLLKTGQSVGPANRVWVISLYTTR